MATVSLGGTLPEKLEAIAEAGFDGVELLDRDVDGFAGTARDAGSLARCLGLTVSIYQPLREFEAVDREQLRLNLDRAERMLDLMGEIGAPLLLVCSNVSATAIDDDGLAAEQLAVLAERAARRGLRVGYEALAWGTHVRTFQHAWRIVKLAAHPVVGLVLDSFHTLALARSPVGLAALDPARIFFVQLADAPYLDLDPLPWSRNHRRFPGDGEMDVPGFMHNVLATGYRGPVSLEIFNPIIQSAPPLPTAAEGMRSLLRLEEQTAGVSRLAA